MSDPLNALPSPSKAHPPDPPHSPRSVGYVRAQRAVLAGREDPLPLECGRAFFPVQVEFETLGRLSARKDNAIMICHALSGDAHVAGWDPDAEKNDRPWRAKRPGWWDNMVGPGKAFDTNKYFVLCANVLGSCYGTTGPGSLDPETGKPYGLRFPLVTMGDWVRLHLRLLDHLGIETLLAVTGGSIGGQQAIEFMLQAPERVRSALVLAAATKLSSQGLGFNKVARQAILSDANFRSGDYYAGPPPVLGLAAARMLGHITYLSNASMDLKFGRRLRKRQTVGYTFDIEYEVESYLDYQAQAFTQRFDANSYLYISRAMDYYDAAQNHGGGDLLAAARKIKSRVLIVSFTSDWLYPPGQCRELAEAMCRLGQPVTYVEIPSIYGHDAFLLETDELSRLVAAFLENIA